MPVLRSGKQVRESTSENVLNQLRKKSNQERRNIRGKSIDWLIGPSEEESLSKRSRLPIKSLVLKRYLHLSQQCSYSTKGSQSTREKCEIIFKELRTVWEKSNIPIKAENLCITAIVRLVKCWMSFKRIDLQARSKFTTKKLNERTSKRIENFSSDILKLFDMSANDCYETLKSSRQPGWKQDYQFLLNQRQTPQIGFMGREDQANIQLEKRRKARQICVEKKRNLTNTQIVQIFSDESSNISESTDEDNEDFIPDRTSTPHPSVITIDLPTRSILKDISQTSDRCNVSIRGQVAMASALIRSGGGNLLDVSLSKSTGHRHRKKQREEKAREIFEEWMANKPKFVVVHWDSKMITKLNGQMNERVAILVSGKPHLEAPKLLGVPIISDSTGLSQKNAVVNLLSTWEVTDNVIGLVFDTTASNTGIHRGCATLLEQQLGRAVLWLACRHHFYELHIKHVWSAVIGDSNSPIEPLLKR